MKTIEDMKLELLSDNSNKFMQTLIDYDIKSKDKYGSNLLHYYIMNYDSIVHPAGVIISEFIKKGLDINDKRKSIIHLTSLGKEKIKHKKSNDEDMFDMLTSIEQQQLNDMLNKVLKEWYRRHMKYHKTK